MPIITSSLGCESFQEILISIGTNAASKCSDAFAGRLGIVVRFRVLLGKGANCFFILHSSVSDEKYDRDIGRDCARNNR